MTDKKEQMYQFAEDIQYFLDFYGLKRAQLQHLLGWSSLYIANTIAAIKGGEKSKVYPSHVYALEYAMNPYIFREMVRQKGGDWLPKIRIEKINKKIDELIGR